MLKTILAALAALFLAAAAHAAVDVNRASQAELEAVKGIGPSLSTVIVSERKNGEFKDWSDFMGRVKGVGERNAAKFSEAGLTVQGRTYVASAADAKPGKAKSGAAKGGAKQPPDAKKAKAAPTGAQQR